MLWSPQLLKVPNTFEVGKENLLMNKSGKNKPWRKFVPYSVMANLAKSMDCVGFQSVWVLFDLVMDIHI